MVLRLTDVLLAQVLARALWPLNLRIMETSKEVFDVFKRSGTKMAESPQDGCLCICAQTMVEVLHDEGVFYEHVVTTPQDKLSEKIPCLKHPKPLELLQWLARFLAKRNEIQRLGQIIKYIGWEPMMHSPASPNGLSDAFYAFIGSLFDEATSRWDTNVEVIEWFRGKANCDGSRYITSKHISNAIEHFCENELSDEDCITVEWMLREFDVNAEEMEVIDVSVPETQLALAEIQEIQDKAIRTECMRHKRLLIQLSISLHAHLTKELEAHILELCGKFRADNSHLNQIVNMTLPYWMPKE